MAALEPFDVLAPSMLLPSGVLARLASWKPLVGWVVDSSSDAKRAVWLGIDVAVSNMPVQQSAYLAHEGDTVCQ